jgi:hypothetical protein
MRGAVGRSRYAERSKRNELMSDEGAGRSDNSKGAMRQNCLPLSKKIRRKNARLFASFEVVGCFTPM